MSETNAQYHADYSRVSNSMLSTLKESPKLFKGIYLDRTIQPKPSTPSMFLGELTHTAFLEPRFFWERYVTAPEGIDRRTKIGKETWAAFQESLNGRDLVEYADAKKAFACADALREHDQIGSLDVSKGIVETRIDFDFHGVEMRCKPDLVLPDLGLIVDIKTSRDASKEGFEKSVVKFGYHRQAFLYSLACESKYNRSFRFLFGVVGIEQPHDTGCYELDADLFSAGADEALTLVLQLKQRAATNDWLHAWSRGVVPLSKPRWHKSGIYALESENELEIEV